MKKINRNLVLKTLIDNDHLSRIEISQLSGLSPSTVTSLVSELLNESVITETGEEVSTGGRKRIDLSINSDYAAVAVLEIQHKGSIMHFFDMQLNELETKVLSDHYISGNDLLLAIITAISEFTVQKEEKRGSLAGIGLLFQEDMSESDFNVIYTTSLSSATISLKDALFTQYHIPVTEDFSLGYTIKQLREDSSSIQCRNSAFIHIGKRIMASVIIDGKQFELKGKNLIDITPLVENEKVRWPILLDENTKLKEGLIPGFSEYYASLGSKMTFLIHQLASVMKPMCTFFPIEKFYISGTFTKYPGFVDAVQNALTKQMQPYVIPEIEAAQEAYNPADNMAGRIRNSILCG